VGFAGWRCDPFVVAPAVLGVIAYALAVARYGRLRARPWPRGRTVWFVLGTVSGLLAIESPLDAAGDVRFAPHMWQHLILTDVTAPLLLLGAPLLLVLGVARPGTGRRIVAVLKSRAGRAFGFPVVGWSAFILSLWILHFSGFFEAALENERLHTLEHTIYLGAALLFWFPVIAIGPAPWARGPLAFPLRMLYLFLAMPAEGMLGFSINGARHVLYPHYAAAGIADQETAGEIMWIGGTLAMFVAFMCVGFEWAVHEQRLGERMNARLDDAL
jgi:putative membrane protein